MIDDQTDVPRGHYKSDKPLHPFCRKCGWRRGGVDSWDGHSPCCRSCASGSRHFFLRVDTLEHAVRECMAVLEREDPAPPATIEAVVERNIERHRAGERYFKQTGRTVFKPVGAAMRSMKVSISKESAP